MGEGSVRPFVDTNVWFSGFYKAGGAPARILELHALGEISIVISRQVLTELVTTLQSKAPQILPLALRFFVAAPPEIAEDPTPSAVQKAQTWINHADAPILAAAVESGADCLITGNTRHFTQHVAGQAGIAILTPAQYLRMLEDRARTS